MIVYLQNCYAKIMTAADAKKRPVTAKKLSEKLQI